MSRLLLVVLVGLGLLGPLSASAQGQDPDALQRLRSAVQTQGRARVIVELRLPAGVHVPEGLLGSQAAIGIQRRDIAAVGAQILSRVRATSSRILHQYDALPQVPLHPLSLDSMLMPSWSDR